MVHVIKPLLCQILFEVTIKKPEDFEGENSKTPIVPDTFCCVGLFFVVVIAVNGLNLWKL